MIRSQWVTTDGTSAYFKHGRRLSCQRGEWIAIICAGIWWGFATPIVAQASNEPATGVEERNDSVSIRLIDVELRAAVQSLGQYLNHPVLVGAGGGMPDGGRVTLETPQPVPRADVLRLLRGIVESQGLAFELDSSAGLYRVSARDGPGPTNQSYGERPDGARAPGGAQAPELFVVRLRHARAADIAATVNALFGRAAALGELGASPGPAPTLGQTLGQQVLPHQPAQLLPPTQGTVAPQLPPGQVAAGAAGRIAQLAGDVTIVPDANSNALLIRAGRNDFELIQAAVQELDVRPLQVLIEIVIAEVRRDRNFNFGLDFSTPERAIPGMTEVRGKVEQKGIGLGDFVLQIMREGPGIDFNATLRASAARGDARILSRPVLLASNGEPAEILVGSQRPFVQVQRSLPTDAPSRDQVVQYKDVGTRLAVTPTISADGYVTLALTQEVNAATAETQFDAPVISTRTVQTVLLVRDSQTVVLGGLSDRQQEANQGGVPILSSIPLLGGLFGRASRRKSETEFFLFVTPRIIRTDAEADAVTDPLERNIERSQP